MAGVACLTQSTMLISDALVIHESEVKQWASNLVDAAHRAHPKEVFTEAADYRVRRLRRITLPQPFRA